MQTYVQKSLVSRVIQQVKTKGSVAQFLRIRLNDDIEQNINFDQKLRRVRTSGREEMKQLPQNERRKYTPNVVADEGPVAADEEDCVLGDEEDIVFEGHGKYAFAKFGRTMERRNATDLSLIVESVVNGFGNPKLWQGRVVLLGCSTAPIVKPLNKRLKKIFGRDINVVGTKADIKVDVLGSEPYAYYVNDESKDPINFTDPDHVKMAYRQWTMDTDREDGFTEVSWAVDKMGIEKAAPTKDIPIDGIPGEDDAWAYVVSAS